MSLPVVWWRTARDGIAGLVKVHFGLGGIELVLAIFGLAIVSNPDTLVECQNLSVQNHVDLIVAVVAIAQLIELSLKCCCCLMVVGSAVDEDRLPTIADHTGFSLVEDRWKVGHVMLPRRANEDPAETKL